MAKRKWLQSVDLAVDDNGVPLIEQYLAKLEGIANGIAPPAGWQIGRTKVGVGNTGPQEIVAGTDGTVAGLLQLLVVLKNNDDGITITDSDGNSLVDWPTMKVCTGPFVDPPAPFTPIVEAPAGKGLKIVTGWNVGEAWGLAIWCKRSA